MTSFPFNTPPDPPESPEASASHSEALQRCGALLASDDFRWFLEVGIGGRIAEANARSVDIREDSATRDHAAHVHDALVKIKAWVAERHEQAREYMSERR